MCKQNNFLLAVTTGQKYIKNGYIITLDIENAFNSMPFETILNGLIFNKIDGTYIKYTMHML